LFCIANRDNSDGRYYYTTDISSPHLPSNIPISFVIDTGASITLISWNDAMDNGIDIRSLPTDDATIIGIGGEVRKYYLNNSTIYFKTSEKTIQCNIPNLVVMNYETTKGIECPRNPSIIGMNVLSGCDVLIKDEIALIFLKSCKLSDENLQAYQ
jgi:predicted metal-dependent peptidase